MKDALDRAGLAAKTAVEVEVSAKPFELVFERIASEPRDPQSTPALESDSIAAIEPDGVIEGEYDDDPLPEDEKIIPSGYTDAESDVIDVEVEAIDPPPITPDDPVSPVSVDLGGQLSVRRDGDSCLLEAGGRGSGGKCVSRANTASARRR